ncbi:MAG TPA: DUF4340 domain-containing protein [Candidatus Acidoferrales bacterium]|nr:DUF4340 domain-containing protein [Candidatus Acidoferrales bacterium]
MKKSTLIVILIAAALGSFVYFYDSKHAAGPAPEDASWKPAFSVQVGDITGLTIQNKSNSAPIVFAKRGSQWNITQPVDTAADQGALSGIVSDLASDKIERSFAPTDLLSKYGLNPAALTLQFETKAGAKHTLKLGDKDFSGTLAYALVDASKQIGMIPVSLLNEANQPLLQLRDRQVLALNGAEISAVSLANPSGDISLAKDSSGWKITQPHPTGADQSAADALVTSLDTAKFTSVVIETSGEAAQTSAKYGLAHPVVTLDLTAKGGQQFHLLIGKGTAKDTKDNYYARDASRPMIFQVDANLYNSLDKKFFDLRDKSVIQFDAAKITSVEIKNANGTIECSQGKDDKWTLVQPVGDKGKAIQSWKVLDPLQNARATAIYDSPSAAILAHLAKPAIEITLTDKSGKTTSVRVSPAVKDSVYIRTSAGPEVYELSTQILKDLGFKPADLLL